MSAHLQPQSLAMTTEYKDYSQGRAQAQRVQVPGAHGGHVYLFGDPQHPPVLEPFPSAALTTESSQGTQGIGTPRLASSALRTRPAPACMSPGQGPHPRTPWGPLTSAAPVVPGQGEASRAGAGEAAGPIVTGMRAGAGAIRALVPVWGAGGAGGLCAQALLPAGAAAGPSQAERPPSSMPGQGQGAHPHKTLPGCPAQSLPDSRFHSLLQGKENRP